jgi:hypothetical protein
LLSSLILLSLHVEDHAHHGCRHHWIRLIACDVFKRLLRLVESTLCQVKAGEPRVGVDVVRVELQQLLEQELRLLVAAHREVRIPRQKQQQAILRMCCQSGFQPFLHRIEIFLDEIQCDETIERRNRVRFQLQRCAKCLPCSGSIVLGAVQPAEPGLRVGR